MTEPANPGDSDSTREELLARPELRDADLAALRESEMRLRRALDIGRFGVWEWNVQTGHVATTEQWARMLGYEPGELPPHISTWDAVCHPDDAAEGREMFMRHANGEMDSIEREYRLRRKDGEWLTVLSSARIVERDGDGAPLRVLGTNLDVTVWKRGEEDIRRAQEEHDKLEGRYRRIVETAREGVWMLDADWRTTFVNSRTAEMLGWRVEEMAGRSMYDFMDEKFATLAKRLIVRRQASATVSFDFRFRHRDGRPVWVIISAARLVDPQGRSEGWLGMLTDIGDRKRTEKELREARDAAERAVRARSQFLANVSHEVRTPLNGIIGMTTVLLDTPLGPEQSEHVRTIRQSGEILLTIINEILDFAKAEAGRLEIDSVPYHLRESVEDAAELVAETAHAKGIELVVLVDPPLPRYMRGDPGRLRQILLNFLANAIKFTTRGYVFLHVRAAEGAAPALRFEVSDTGIGIPAARLGGLFQPFHQLDSSTTRRHGGTGLGLAISRQLAERMGGSVDATSVPGEGSTFWLELPLDAVPDAQAPRPGYATEGLGGRKVLVVHPLPVKTSALAAKLRALGCVPVVANVLEGAAAEAAMLGPGDAALVDESLAGGGSASRALRAVLAERRAKAVLLCRGGYSIPVIEGNDYFVARLRKPIRLSALARTLRAALEVTGGQPHRSSSGIFLSDARRVEAPPVSLRTLLVEDNVVNQKVATMMLARFGVRCDVAANGVEAIAACERLEYDLIFMDCMMPEMDGFEATRRIRAMYAESETRPLIAAMTAAAMREDRERCMEAGMDDYLAKPITPESLRDLLKRRFGMQ